MAKPFEQSMRSRSAKHDAVVRRYEIARTTIEFLAAAAFVVGSILFFYPTLVYSGTWLFLMGSIFFAVRPTVRLALELHLASIPVAGEVEAVDTR